jgi:hypothetical protein
LQAFFVLFRKRGTNRMKKINRIIALMMTLVMLTGTYGPALNVYASEAEKTAVSENAAVT